MKNLHELYEEFVIENMKLRIHISELTDAKLDIIKESLELKLINTELELKLAKYELDISRKGV
jgi:hypothetical protein